MKNAFNMEIPKIRDLFRDKDVENYIKSTLTELVINLGYNPAKALQVADGLILEAKRDRKIGDYEAAAHEVLEREGIAGKIPQNLSNRAELSYSQIKDFIEGRRICDFGCGDGKVGQKIAQQGLDVILADIYENPNVSSTGIKFKSIDKSSYTADLPPDYYDTAIVLTVLHHSSDPLRTLQEAKRITKNGGRIIVIESVYGISAADKTPEPHERNFTGLTEEQQRQGNIFFDHFYNRVIHYTDDPNQKGGVNPAAAAVAGAVVGAAAVGIAAVAVLADDKSRKKVEKVIDVTKDKVEDIKEDVKEKIAEGQEKVKEVLTAVKEATHDVAKAAK